MDYSATLSKGWGITWRHKWMWLLTLIPALAGLLSFGLSAFQQNALLSSGTATTPDEVISQMGGLMLINCLILIVSLVIGIIGLATRGGLIAAVAGIDRGESYTFGRAFGAGWRKLLPLIGMSLLLIGGFFVLSFLVAIILVVVFSIGAFAGGAAGDDSLLAGLGLVGILGICCGMILFLVAALVINLVYPFAFRGIVLRDLGVIDSIRHGWGVARENLGEIILLALPFFLLGLLLGGVYAAFAFGSSIAAVMSGDPTAMMGQAFGWQFFIFFIIWTFISAVLAAWQSATFTLGYLRWTGKDVLAG
jgi:hypothetical protein